MLELIHNDHKNLAILLNLLDEKLERIRGEESINYKLIGDVLDYMQEYAEKYHHRFEDILYDYYLERFTERAPERSRLHKEHEMLLESTAGLLEMVQMIMLDTVVPRELFADRLDAFVKQQRRHMEYEEREVLPDISSSFAPEDWLAVAKRMPETAECEDQQCVMATATRLDPLFGEQVAERYRELAKRLQRRSEDVTSSPCLAKSSK